MDRDARGGKKNVEEEIVSEISIREQNLNAE